MSTKKKIVVLIDWYLPGTKAGGPVRSIYSLIRLLKDKYEFYILTSNRDLGSQREYENIQSDVLFESEGVYYRYFSKRQLNEKEILATIKQIEPALVYLNSFWSYSFSVSVVRAKHRKALKIPLLLAPRGMLSSGALGLKYFKKRAFLFAVKFFGWYNSIPFHATNEQEKNEILNEFPDVAIKIASNVNAIKATSTLKTKNKNELRLFYLSRISKVKNLLFALEALKAISPEVQITYDIFGNVEDASYWEQCKYFISQLPEHIQVNYKGEIPFEQVQSTLLSYHALLLPTLNENFGHSIVESLSSGCIAIISDQTPWNDLEGHHSGYALPLSDRSAFTKALEELALLDQVEFQQRSENAITYISTKINLEQSRQQYISLFNESIKN
jgi:glycosyltransferase involved in cell wall biosynthesis